MSQTATGSVQESMHIETPFLSQWSIQHWDQERSDRGLLLRLASQMLLYYLYCTVIFIWPRFMISCWSTLFLINVKHVKFSENNSMYILMVMMTNTHPELPPNTHFPTSGLTWIYGEDSPTTKCDLAIISCINTVTATFTKTINTTCWLLSLNRDTQQQIPSTVVSSCPRNVKLNLWS